MSIRESPEIRKIKGNIRRKSFDEDLMTMKCYLFASLHHNTTLSRYPGTAKKSDALFLIVSGDYKDEARNKIDKRRGIF